MGVAIPNSFLGRTLSLAVALAAALTLGSVALAQSPTPTAPATIAACPSGVSISVAAPAAGSTTATVTVSPAVNIKPASAGDPTSLHLHYFVDTPAAAAGQAIPTGNPKIIHSGSTTQDLGSLDPGQHTVTVVLGQLNHTACDARGSASFTVAQAVAGAQPGTARTGTGGFLSGAGEGAASALPAVLGAVGLLALLGARFARRAR